MSRRYSTVTLRSSRQIGKERMRSRRAYSSTVALVLFTTAVATDPLHCFPIRRLKLWECHCTVHRDTPVECQRMPLIGTEVLLAEDRKL